MRSNIIFQMKNTLFPLEICPRVKSSKDENNLNKKEENVAVRDSHNALAGEYNR